MRIGNFDADLQPSSQHAARLHQISSIFTQDVLDNVMFPLLEQSQPSSLRVLDWLCVNYSKKNVVSYTVTDRHANQEHFDLHRSYSKWLRNFRRKGFDVFRRGNRVRFCTSSGVEVQTTVAQLNFCVWLMRNQVLCWIRQHHAAVEHDMNMTLSQARRARLAGTRRKRSQLVPGKQLPVCISTTQRVLVFDRD